MARTAFVTGANGFIGLNLVEELLDQGWSVVAMHRRESNIEALAELDVQRVIGDVTDSRTLRRVVPTGADAIFHVAGLTSLWSRRVAEQTRVNVKGTRNMVRLALETGARRFIHTSSVVAYGMHTGTVTEETPTRGTNAPINYVRSKALAEREVRRGIRRGLDAVIINPANVLGPHDRGNWSRLFRLTQQHRLPGMPPGGNVPSGGGSVVRAACAARPIPSHSGYLGARRPMRSEAAMLPSAFPARKRPGCETDDS